jgi:hypothetical protein
VAMKNPDTRVIGLECNHHVSFARKHSNITASRVTPLGLSIGIGGVKGTVTLDDDVEIVTMKMDRMGKTDTNFLNDKVVPLSQC